MGLDDHVTVNEDWMLPSPSPRSLFSALMGDDFGLRSMSESNVENKNDSIFTWTEGKMGSENAGPSGTTLPAFSSNTANEPSVVSEQRTGQRSGLLERMAARAGFNAPKLNTESIRPSGILQNTGIRSPYLKIPPGLSPTVLESPVFLSNSLAQPSPTTGMLQFALKGNDRRSTILSESTEKNKENFSEDFSNSSFSFKPAADSASLSHATASKATPPHLACGSFPSFEVSDQSEISFLNRSLEPGKLHSKNGGAAHLQSDVYRASAERNADGTSFSAERRPMDVSGNAQSSPPLSEKQDEDTDLAISEDTNANNAPSEDGYNWRKYGQKQVKGSDYPRSYFKCTSPNCPVKKKVERSHEGHITEIIYKGAHNHQKPPANRRSTIGSSNTLSDLQADVPENLEVTSSATSVSMQGQNGTRFESTEAGNVSSTFSDDEEEDEQGTHGSVSLGYDGEGDESESKRRKVEAYAADINGASRAIREPRVVVQTTSEVDILDDGYRWRKYGQKVVKGNPNPRSYYKCTSAGCTVRKHVERASHDLKSVITTYEGKHNHDVPAARNNSHVNQSSMQPLVLRPDISQLANDMTRFERPNLLGAYGIPGRQQFGTTNGFGFGMNQPGLANLGMAGLGPNQGNLPMLPVHQYLGQPRPTNEMGFMFGKGEPKLEPILESGVNHPSSSSSVYHQMLNRLPLGHQM